MNLPAFQKKLYVRQGFPDSYVDPTFLRDLRCRPPAPTALGSLLFKGDAITFHLSSIVVFLVGFFDVYHQRHSRLPWSLAGSPATVLAVYAVANGPRHCLPGRDALQLGRSLVLSAAALLGLSPILQTLTKDTTDDSIWALSAALFVVSVCFRDYRTAISGAARLPDSLAINAAVFASVVLASRLRTNLEVFFMVANAIAWFALFPRLIRSLKPAPRSLLWFAIAGQAAMLAGSVSMALAASFSFALLVAHGAAPLWLTRLHHHKRRIQWKNVAIF